MEFRSTHTGKVHEVGRSLNVWRLVEKYKELYVDWVYDPYSIHVTFTNLRE